MGKDGSSSNHAKISKGNEEDHANLDLFEVISCLNVKKFVGKILMKMEVETSSKESRIVAGFSIKRDNE